MTNKELATFAKSKGYEYISTVVKQVFNTQYFNINHVDYILSTGKFHGLHNNNGRYNVGLTWRELPVNTIDRVCLRDMYDKEHANK